MTDIEPFVVTPFKGVLCLFLLDMGLVASRGIRQGARDLSVPLGIFAIVMPLVGGVLGAVVVGCEETVSGSLWRSSQSWRCLHGGGYFGAKGGEIDRRAR